MAKIRYLRLTIDSKSSYDFENAILIPLEFDFSILYPILLQCQRLRSGKEKSQTRYFSRLGGKKHCHGRIRNPLVEIVRNIQMNVHMLFTCLNRGSTIYLLHRSMGQKARQRYIHPPIPCISGLMMPITKFAVYISV